ncbi:unnamed protein product [Adineta ricciae]|uniref:Uncharacterized protein n=1 Tax=Adineta ricciae TaxID=249248 RepID=A0A814EGU9_ADIRI|nr:unnamed protein product [Adineta ricciae]CAF1012424.1 unnamed protein product [Adineta ricciae]
MSASGQVLHERARSLLALIDGLQIENDLASSRRTLEEWRTEMFSLINNIHLSTTNKLDSLTGRLNQLKQRHSAVLTQDIIPNLSKTVVERRKSLSDQEYNDLKAKITKIDTHLQVFGRLLTKITNDEKKLTEQVDILKNIQRENTELSQLDKISTPSRRFLLHSSHSPYVAVSDNNQILIEDDDHLVFFDEERRVNEIPWQKQNDDAFIGSIKDIVYSNYLEQFCVLSSVSFFTIDPRMSTLDRSEQIKPSTGSHFQSIACLPNASDAFFALTTSGSRTNIERWSFLSGSLVKRWYHDIFESDDRLVSCIRANDTCLAICIKQQRTERHSHQTNEHWRVDVFDFTLVRMYRGINLKSGGLGMYITPFDDRSWLVINGNDVWLLGEQGECVEERHIHNREQVHNIIVRDEDIHGQRQFIVKMGQPAELRVIYNHSRLYCILVHTHSSHERFIQLSNLTWGKNCYKIGVARFRKVQKSDDDFDIPQLSYYVNLWTRVLIAIRNSVSSYDFISNNDILLIVPAPTFVFREKLSILLNSSSYDAQYPFIVVHEQHEGNAYVLNGQALNLVRHTELMDQCLRHLHPTARERHLWKCVQDALHEKYLNNQCKNDQCYVQYHEYHITLAHIKNGYCYGDYLHTCRSIALLYPTSLGDFITLEFFRYRLKAKSSQDLL